MTSQIGTNRNDADVWEEPTAQVKSRLAGFEAPRRVRVVRSVEPAEPVEPASSDRP